MPSTTADDVIAANIALVHKADAAVNARDVEAFLALMTDDVVWESTSPPDGERLQGKAAVRAGGMRERGDGEAGQQRGAQPG